MDIYTFNNTYIRPNHQELERKLRTVETSEGAGEDSAGSVTASEDGVDGQECSSTEKAGEDMASVKVSTSLSRM